MDIRKRLNFFVFLFPVVIILLGIWNGRWLATGINLLVGLLTLLGGLALCSQFLFPVSGRRVRWQAFQCLFYWAIGQNRPSYVVRDGKDEKRVDGNPFSPLGPGVVLVDSCSAVALYDGLTATRVLGAGEGFIEGESADDNAWSSVYSMMQYERIRGVVDLRWQNRHNPRFQVLTRDGIKLEMELWIDFEIERDPARNHPDRPYTFAERSVYRAVYGEGVLENPDVRYDWTEAVLTIATDKLRHVVAQYTLDQLFAADRREDPFNAIEKQVEEALHLPVSAQGAHLIGITLGSVGVPTDVIAQRVESWQVTWESRKAIIHAQAENEARRREEQARAQAQTEMIQSIVQSLQGLEDQPAHDVITLRLIEALEKMSHDPLTRARLPPQVQTAISTLFPQSRLGA